MKVFQNLFALIGIGVLVGIPSNTNSSHLNGVPFGLPITRIMPPHASIGNPVHNHGFGSASKNIEKKNNTPLSKLVNNEQGAGTELEDYVNLETQVVKFGDYFVHFYAE